MMSVPLELVPSDKTDKIAEVVLSDGRFAEIFRPRVIHMIGSEDYSDMRRSVKMLMQIVKIDDKDPSVEDILALDVHDFNELLKQAFKK